MSDLNLRKSIVDDYWKQKDTRTAKILDNMSSLETWTLDEHKNFSEALLTFSNIVSDQSFDKLKENMDKLTKILAYMSSSRAVRFLEWGDQKFILQKGLALEMVKNSRANSDSPHYQLLQDRLRTLRGVNVLSYVFSEKRLDLVMQLLDAEKKSRF